MKYLYCIFFVNILIANNNSVTIDMTVTANDVSNVSVNKEEVMTTLTNIFDLRNTTNSEKNVDDIEITYQTNIANQKLTLTSSEKEGNDFYLHHDNHTSNNKIRLLLNITKKTEDTQISPNSNTLASTTSNASVADNKLTINITLKPIATNAANAGEYSSTLTVAWVNTN